MINPLTTVLRSSKQVEISWHVAPLIRVPGLSKAWYKSRLISVSKMAAVSGVTGGCLVASMGSRASVCVVAILVWGKEERVGTEVKDVRVWGAGVFLGRWGRGRGGAGPNREVLVWEEVFEVREPGRLRAVKIEGLGLGRGPGFITEKEAGTGAELVSGVEAGTGAGTPDTNAEGAGVGSTEATEDEGPR